MQGRRRQGKFQPFRRLFGKRKKRVADKGFDAAEIKASFSTEEVCNGVLSDDEETNRHLRELTPIGTRALSHDSVFIPEEPVQDDRLEETMSQENISDKVRNIQRQIGRNIKFGQKPSQRRSEGEEGSSDEEDVPRSPLKVLAQVETEPGDTEPKVHGAEGSEQGHGTPAKSPRSKRMLPATSGTIESINLDSVPHSVPLLDNTAAKHKLAVKPKNQRSRKHRRFTQEISLPDSLQEEIEGHKDKKATGVSTDGQRQAPENYESPEKSKKQRVQDDEVWESRRKREREEERLRQEALEEERRKREEELRLRELEEERKREEERRIMEEENRRIREEEEKRVREEEERIRREQEERSMREEERKRREEEERRRVEEQRKKEEEECLRLEEEERLRVEKEKAERQEREEKRQQEEAERKRRQQEEEQKRLSTERAEEVRWKEMEERQRPFSFKVSSGEKQILFQKVNLTPVTPASGPQCGAVVELPEGSKVSSHGGGDSPSLPSSQYVPHTAILVTGAQLCGPAVNLDQIKDSACKSLLGLGDDRKAMGTPKNKTSPERKSGKTKSLNEAFCSGDQSSAAILAEWASIRSKIFKGAEEGKYEDYPEPSPKQSSPDRETQSSFPHTNLRKTMSASAKFSITPARKKFSDSKRNSEVLSQEDKESGKTETASPDSSPPAGKAQGKAGKMVRIAHRSEGCMFAKDLPSFLVPNSGQGSSISGRPEFDGGSGSEVYQSDERDDEDEENQENGQDRPSPFGIKLRRTNYSLRYHSEQPTEKRKKRYSAGDSFDGVPSPLTPIEPESSPSMLPSPASAASPLRENAGSRNVHPTTVSSQELRTRAGKSPSPSLIGDADAPPSKPAIYQRLGTSPKPASTPPPSPLPKAGRGGVVEAKREAVGRGSEEQEKERREESSAVAQLHRGSQGEEEPREKKSFFPSISIPWREKTDRRTELRREKPSLQSRHSLDSVRIQDKEGPMWITLALQKQKGFREQQQTRDDRRSQREAKLAEKQARERDSSGSTTPSGSKGSCSPVPPETAEEAKRPDTLLGRFERRDHLKKANTLPSSVTVEITDSTPSPPAVKEVSKRLPASDSGQMSTEPAWLALAKRKAKAWSDCPQIIK